MKTRFKIGLLAALIVGIVLMSGCSSTEPSTAGDQVAIDKMSSMITEIKPTSLVIVAASRELDFVKWRRNEVLLRDYIDKNLPEMRQLANGATTQKAAALEFVAFLEDRLSASDKTVMAIDKYNSGDYTGYNRIMESAILDVENATAHANSATEMVEASTLTPKNCNIDNSQTGQIEILKYDYASALPNERYSSKDKRVIGKAKNVGTNTISGTIEYTYYFENKSILKSFVYKFCNIEPNQEFEFIIPDVRLTNSEQNIDDLYYWNLNAGQKITTTGKGPRGSPYSSQTIKPK